MGMHAAIFLFVFLLKQKPSRISPNSSKKVATARGDRPIVSRSTSMKIGWALLYNIAFMVATKVKACVITSSPLCTPTNLKATWSAEVPLTTATAFAEPDKSDIIPSNLSTNGPIDDT